MSSSFPLSRIDTERPAVVIDGQAYPPIAYMAYLPRQQCYREAADCGVHLYCFPAYLAGRGINTRTGIGPFRSGRPWPRWTRCASTARSGWRSTTRGPH